MRIDVTQEHIDKALDYATIRRAYNNKPGIRMPKDVWCSFSCPIALAATEACGKEAQVNGTTVALDVKEDYMLPSEAQEFINEFDLGGTVVPFSFELVM